jgi:hypothetical protein
VGTTPGLFNVRETVAVETPARRATSLMFARDVMGVALSNERAASVAACHWRSHYFETFFGSKSVSIYACHTTLCPATNEATEMTDFFRNVHCVMGLPIDAMSMEEAVQLLQLSRSSREKCCRLCAKTHTRMPNKHFFT